MTQQIWKEKTGSIIHAIIFYCLLLVVEAGLALYQYSQMLDDFFYARGLGDLIKAIFNSVGIEDVIIQILLFVSYIWLISVIKGFGHVQEDLQTKLSLEKVGNALWLNFAAAVVGMIPLPIFCSLASLIMEICSYVMMVSAFRYLMSSPVFNAVARGGAGTLKSYAVWSIWGIIPIVGGLFRFIAWIQFIRGWSNMCGGSPIEVIPLQNNASANIAYLDLQTPTDEYLRKADTKTDEDLKTILQHKTDYHPQLVKAAEKILLDRITGVAKPKGIDSEPVGAADTEAKNATAEVNADKYKAYQPSVRTPIYEEEAAPQSVKTRDNSFDVIREGWKSKAKEESQPTAAQPEKEVSPVVASSNSSLTVLLSILGGILLTVGGALTYFLWYVPYVTDRDAPRTYVVADNVFLRSSRLAGVEYNILRKVPYGSEVITYNKLGEWAEVKVDGQEGVIAATYLLDSSDFTLLSGIWGDNDSKDCIISSKCRIAILDYFKNNLLKSGANAWQIYTKPINQKPNTVFYPRIYDRNSKFTDFVFIARENITGNRILVCYSFDCASEKPIFRFSVGAPQVGYIQNIVLKSRGATVVFDNGEHLNIPL